MCHNVYFTTMEIKFSELKEYEKLKVISEISLIKDKCNQFQQKYELEFSEFEIHINTTSKEVFEEWDDYIEWKAYNDSLNNLEQKFREIENATDITILKDE